MAATRRGRMCSRPAWASRARRSSIELKPISSVGCSSLRAATILSNG